MRRDVFLRVANLVKKLNEHDRWILVINVTKINNYKVFNVSSIVKVLPPWGQLYHWRPEKRNTFYSWKEFFDIESLNKWIPVMELEDFIDSM